MRSNTCTFDIYNHISNISHLGELLLIIETKGKLFSLSIQQFYLIISKKQVIFQMLTAKVDVMNQADSVKVYGLLNYKYQVIRIQVQLSFIKYEEFEDQSCKNYLKLRLWLSILSVSILSYKCYHFVIQILCYNLNLVTIDIMCVCI